jgi:hypothetical protein
MRSRIDPQYIFTLLDLGDYVMPFALRTVCLLNVADALEDGPRTVPELAESTRCQPRPLDRLLRYLATKNVFAEVEPGRFALTPVSDLLRTAHPFSAREVYLAPLACMRALERLDHSIRTGEPAFDQVHGQGMWDYLTAHPDEGARFDGAMSGATRLELLAILRVCDWSRFATVVDVGGGNGALLARLLARHRAMRGVLLDLPQVVSGAVEVLAEAGVAERCQIVAGNFLTDRIPEGGDAYVLKRILYSWDDDQARGILRAVRSAMHPRSRLFVMEATRQGEQPTALAARLDVLMLALSGGGARDLDEQRRLLDGAGLELVRTLPTPMFPILEARPV